MTTAMITACFTGLVRAVGILISAVICSAECIYFPLFSESPEATGENKLYNPSRPKPLFSGAFFNAEENSVCNPYRFKNASKLTAKAMSFIFFIHPGADRLATCVCKNHSSSGNYFSNSEFNFYSIHRENYHSSTLRRQDVTGKPVYGQCTQKPTTCL
jgi:hypothetical protein